MNQYQQIPPPQRPVGPPGMGPGPTGGPPPPYSPHAPRPVRRGRVWPWIIGGVLVVAVAAGVVAGNMTLSEILSSPTATRTYPEWFPKQKYPAQVDGYKFDLKGSQYQILRPSRQNPNSVDISRSVSIVITDWSIRAGGAKEYVEKNVKKYLKDKKIDELEPGVYCNKTVCYATSNSGRVWETWDSFDSLSGKQQARWTAHFIAAVKE